MKLEREPEKERRLLAAALAFVSFTLAAVLLVFAAEEAGASHGALSVISGSAIYSGPAVIFAAWRWPDVILRPLSAAWRSLRR